MTAAMAGPYEVSGAAHLPGDGTLLRLEGHAPSVAARAETLAGALVPFGAADMIDRDASLTRWRRIRDAMPFADVPDRAIWRVSVAPSEGPRLVAALSRALDFKHFYDWAGGLVWLAVAERRRWRRGGDPRGAARR